jgi:hypothetical protein
VLDEGLHAQTIALPDHFRGDGVLLPVTILSYSLIGGLGGPTTTVVVNEAATELTGAFPYMHFHPQVYRLMHGI